MSILDPLVAELPILEGMSKGVRMAYPFARALAPSSLSASAIMQHLRSNGLHFTDSQMRLVIHSLRGTLESQSYINALHPDHLPNPLRIPPSDTATLRRYTYTVELSGINSITGEPHLEYINVATSDLMTKRAAIDAAIGMLVENPKNYNITSASGTVVQVIRDPSKPVQ